MTDPESEKIVNRECERDQDHLNNRECKTAIFLPSHLKWYQDIYKTYLLNQNQKFYLS